MSFIDGIINTAAIAAAHIAHKYEQADDKINITGRIDGIKNVYGKARKAGQRAVRGYSDDQIYELWYNELTSLSKKLHRFAETTHGSPSDYDDKSKWLKPRDDDWEDSIAPWHAKEQYELANSDDELITSKDNNGNPLTYRIPTCKECGVDYCAWIEDIDYAADVIDEYVRMNDNILIYSGISDMFGKDEADKRTEMINKEFKRVWAWLGDNMLSLWD